jgi:CRISPR type III-A-associated protein Csm2
MSDEVQPVVENIETPKPEETPAEPVKQEAATPAPQPRPQGDRGPRPEKGKGGGPSGAGPRPAQAPSGDRGPRPGGGERGDRGPRPEGGPRGDNRGGDRREGGRPNFGGGGGRPFDGPVDIELEKLISDSLYLDNQAHVVVMRMRDMDSGTKSQLRRLYNAVRRAVRAPESERQHQFVMLRARLAYTIARHSLRSLDALERLLLQVTRKNDARGYERFKDLFEAIVAYNE